MQVTAKSTGFDETDVLVWYATKADVYRLWGLDVDPGPRPENDALVPLWFCTDMVNERRGVYLPARRLLVCSWAEMDNLARGKFDDLTGHQSGDVNVKTFALRVDVSRGLPVLQDTLPFEAPGLRLDLDFPPGKRVLKIASRGIGPPDTVPRLLPKVPESYIQPGDDTNAHWAAHFPQTTKKEATRKLARVLLAQKAVMNAMKQEEGVVVMFPSFFEMFVAFTGLDRVGFTVEPLSRDRLAELEMAQAPAGFKVLAVMFIDRDGLPVDYFCSYWNLQ